MSALKYFLIVLMVVPLNLLAQTTLYSKTTQTGTVTDPPDSNYVKRVNITFNVSDLRSTNNTEFIIGLVFSGSDTLVPVVAEKTRQSVNDRYNSFSWYGKLKNQPHSYVLFTEKGNKVSGYIRTQRGDVFQIIYRGNKVHQLILVNKIFNRADKVIKATIAQTPPPPLLECNDTTGRIDLLVVYTEDAWVKSANAIESQILHSADLTNQSFFNSGLNVSVEVVEMKKVTYTETGNVDTDLSKLIGTSDGAMDDVHSMRDNVAADIVVMLVDYAAAVAGAATVMETVSPDFAEFAFCVVQWQEGSSKLLFPHEIGHLMGARHECSLDPAMTPFSYSHALSTNEFRTIMSAEIRGNLNRVLYWSGPLVQYQNDRGTWATGTASSSNTVCSEDDVQTLTNTIAVVQQFRCKQQKKSSKLWMYILAALLLLLVAYGIIKRIRAE